MVKETTAALLDARLAAEQAKRLPSIAAGLNRDGELVWSGGRGRTDGRPDGLVPDADTQYRIGSITKTFVAVLVMRLRDEGLLRLTDTLDQHVPGTGFGDATIAQLLSHTSGLRSESDAVWWERAPGGDFDELAARTLTPEAGLLRPGSRFHYSNPGFGALGEVVARIRGRAWHEVLADEVLAPLGMTRTTTRPQAPAAQGLAVHPWADVLLPEPEHDAGAMAPAGQLWSTITDQLRFGAFLAGKGADVLTTATLEEMREPQTVDDTRGAAWQIGYGLGLQLWNVEGRRSYGHSGSMPGFIALLRIEAATSDTACLLVNATAGLGPTLAGDLLKTLADNEPRIAPEWTAGGVSENAMAVVGPWYWGASPIAVRATAEGLDLSGLGTRARSSRFVAAGTDPETDIDTWTGRDGYYAGETLRAIRGDDGAVTHLDLGSFIFTRTPYDPAAPVPGGVDEAGWGPVTA